MEGRGGRIAVAALAAIAITLAAAGRTQATIFYDFMTFNASDGAQVSQSLTCKFPGHEVAISGGFSANSFPEDLAYLNALFPIDSAPPTTWIAYGDNRTGGAASNNFLIGLGCDDNADFGQYKVRASASRPVPDGTEKGTSVSCRHGEHVVGGGVNNSGTYTELAHVNSTAPFDSRDKGKTPDDGWRVEVNNGADASAGTEFITAYAVCDRKRGLKKLFYKTVIANVPDAGFDGQTPGCGDGREILGGGVRSHSEYKHSLFVAATRPEDDPGDNGDYWTGFVHNVSTPDGKAREISVTAICLG